MKTDIYKGIPQK